MSRRTDLFNAGCRSRDRARPFGPSLNGVLFLLMVLVGCDRTQLPAAVAPTVPPGAGVVDGAVRFTGTAPVPADAQGECCPGVPRPADEAVVLNGNGTLRNVVVYIKDGPNVAGPAPGQAVLAQAGCRYLPHVLALRVGQQLVVTNRDPTLHNVHVDPSTPGNPADNVGEIPGGSHALAFPSADDDVVFKCDVHPYMRAHAMVFAHPCYAVTGDDGTFRIERLPPGTYTLVAHHEQFGDLQQPVTVSAGRPTADARFDYHR